LDIYRFGGVGGERTCRKWRDEKATKKKVRGPWVVKVILLYEKEPGGDAGYACCSSRDDFWVSCHRAGSRSGTG